MKSSSKILVSFALLAAVLLSCSNETEEISNQSTELVKDLVPYPSETLPEGLDWITNNDDPIFASPHAKKGGAYRTYMNSFPLTLRSSGPDSSSMFANYIRAFEMSLTGIHPETYNPIPSLATHWAFADDGVTVFYKLDPNARWSDGKKITADDYLFTLEFMRSKHIVSPAANEHYKNQILDIKKYDDYTISITGANKRPPNDLLYYYGSGPTPRHFHKLDENWVKNYNWKIEPNTGAYQISEVAKGKYIEYSRKKDWWAKDYRYLKNRYNVDKIRIRVIRELQIAYQHFAKGKLDTFYMVWPDFWHDKATGPEYDSGYIHKIQFYYDSPQPLQGYFLNTEFEIFKDINVRHGLAHALNVQKVIDVIIRGDYRRQHTSTAGYGKYSNPDIRAREFDLGKADYYFNLAGWKERGPDGIRVKDGRRLSAKVTYGQNNLTERLVIYREEAKKAGFELELELLDRSAEHKKNMDKKHEIASIALAPGFRPRFWGLFHSENAGKPNTQNFSNIKDAELDKLIDAYRFGTEEEERQRLSREIIARIHELSVFIPTYAVGFNRHGYWRWVKLPEHHGTRSSQYLFPPTGGGLFWMDQELKKKTLAAKKANEKFDPVTIVNETYKVP